MSSVSWPPFALSRSNLALLGAGAAAGALATLAVLRGGAARKREAPALPAFSAPASAPSGAKTASTDEAEAAALKTRIQAHYDDCSPHYQQLWGEHVHHGLWRPGQEGLSKEEAQVRLVEELYARARLPAGGRVLDVGCGVGGTSNWLAARGHDVTGVSLSPVQVEMAKRNMAGHGVSVRFLAMDAEALSFPGEDGTFDAVWCSESCSHYPHKERFFAHVRRLLKPGGKLVMVDWFAADVLGSAAWTGVIARIEKGMLLPPIGTVTGYANMHVRAGLRPIASTDETSLSQSGGGDTPANPPPPPPSSIHSSSTMCPRSAPRPGTFRSAWSATRRPGSSRRPWAPTPSPSCRRCTT